MQECTFKPQINSKSRSVSPNPIEKSRKGFDRYKQREEAESRVSMSRHLHETQKSTDSSQILNDTADHTIANPSILQRQTNSLFHSMSEKTQISKEQLTRNQMLNELAVQESI